MSSTAIALQSLKEKGLMGTTAGQQSFAVLLFQDIAVIPILALLPLLATAPATADSHAGSGLSQQPGWVQTLAVASAVAVVIAAGRFVVAPALRVVARTRLRELFTASALLIVVATALLMQKVGLSPALGTFLAGMVLANSEFKHELESDLDPFKGLLLGLFFMGVGASIDFHPIAEEPGRIALLTAGVVLLKILALLALGRRAGLSLEQNLLFSLGLSQVGEFAFVLFAFIAQLGLIDGATSGTLMAVTALSMASTPLLMLLLEKVVLTRLTAKSAPSAPPTKSRRNTRSSSPASLISEAPWGASCARTVWRPPSSTTTRTASISFVGWVSRSTTATPPAPTCCSPRALPRRGS